MSLFAERPAPAVAPARRKTEESFKQWMEDWYWEGNDYQWAQREYEDLFARLNRRLHALKSMSDKQYVAMRNRRHVQWPDELLDKECSGVLLSARALKIRETRDRLRSLDGRLRTVAGGLPYLRGFAVDQDHFNLRCYGRWYTHWRLANYLSWTERLNLFKDVCASARCQDERFQKEQEAERLAEEHPKLLQRIRELEARCTTMSEDGNTP